MKDFLIQYSTLNNILNEQFLIPSVVSTPAYDVIKQDVELCSSWMWTCLLLVVMVSPTDGPWLVILYPRTRWSPKDLTAVWRGLHDPGPGTIDLVLPSVSVDLPSEVFNIIYIQYISLFCSFCFIFFFHNSQMSACTQTETSLLLLSFIFTVMFLEIHCPRKIN